MSTLKTTGISLALKDVIRETITATLASFVMLMGCELLGLATPAFVMMTSVYSLGLRHPKRFLYTLDGHEFIITRGATRKDMLLRKFLPTFAFWPASIIFLLVLPPFQGHQNYHLFFLAVTAGFMISASVAAFFRSKAIFPIIGLAVLFFVMLILLKHSPISLPAIIIESLVMATIALLLLVVACRRFLKMEVL